VGGTAKILYLIYVVLTLCEVLALRLAGESWFSAVCHSFTTMATGGFSIYDTSLAGASKAVMWIVTVFSFLAGVNFSLMFLAVRGKLKEVLRSEELRIYVGIVAAATLLLCINLRVQAGVPFGDSITDAAFQTVTIMTTTGAFNVWGQPVMLTNGGPNYQTQVLLMDIRNLAFPAGPAAAGMASAMALLLGIILMAIAAIQLIFMNKED
jgi:Trk-type K+ transport system membrane component